MKEIMFNLSDTVLERLRNNNTRLFYTNATPVKINSGPHFIYQETPPEKGGYQNQFIHTEQMEKNKKKNSPSLLKLFARAEVLTSERNKQCQQNK